VLLLWKPNKCFQK